MILCSNTIANQIYEKVQPFMTKINSNNNNNDV